MEELTPLDHRLIYSAGEAIEVLRCLNSNNLYKAECLLCQIWQEYSPKRRPWIGARFKWLVDKSFLPGVEPYEIDSDRKMRYRVLR